MTKQHLWQLVYIEAMRQDWRNDPKELADKAVKDYEERFENEIIEKFLKNRMKTQGKEFVVPEELDIITAIHVIATDKNEKQSINYVFNPEGPTYEQESELEQYITKLINLNDRPHLTQ